MEKLMIKRFFECLLPVSICNLKCNYCYVIQRNYRNMKLSKLNYTPEHIGKCLTKDRLGGACFFSICGSGETMIQPEIVDIAHELVKNGHLVNITTNGTITNQFKKFATFSKDQIQRMHFSFSLHYLELKQKGLLDVFFQNVKLVHSFGASFMVQLNLCDDYLPYLEEIKQLCVSQIGDYPQIAATRKEQLGLNQIELYTDLSYDKYIEIGKSFNSNLFDYTMDNFNRPRTEFCYAGERSGTLNLETGALTKCYAEGYLQYIFDNPNKAIKFEPVGKNCHCSFCFNSSHFMSLGVIDNNDSRTYCELRDRAKASWFNPTFRYALSHKLSETNFSYSDRDRALIDKILKIKYYIYRVRDKIIRIERKFKGKN